ncbi:hypothetical protein B296_00049917 [Ensete ventricosum]|uniref:Uncharacterized protein n=1 Tax=Ensete ventricosum TaxID=4639 RepID=A0A426WXY0_ENSVE|nr:hypothetical protein B296_00049917 [Ensete ventricosum]
MRQGLISTSREKKGPRTFPLLPPHLLAASHLVAYAAAQPRRQRPTPSCLSLFPIPRLLLSLHPPLLVTASSSRPPSPLLLNHNRSCFQPTIPLLGRCSSHALLTFLHCFLVGPHCSPVAVALVGTLLPHSLPGYHLLSSSTTTVVASSRPYPSSTVALATPSSPSSLASNCVLTTATYCFVLHLLPTAVVASSPRPPTASSYASSPQLVIMAKPSSDAPAPAGGQPLSSSLITMKALTDAAAVLLLLCFFFPLWQPSPDPVAPFFSSRLLLS